MSTNFKLQMVFRLKQNLLGMLIASLLPLVVITGCQNIEVRNGVTHYVVPDKVREKMWQAEVCCMTLDSIPYSEIQSSQTRLVKFNASLPTYNFSTGTSYFLAYQIAKGKKSIRLTIKSYLQKYSLKPKLLVLDKNYFPVADVTVTETVISRDTQSYKPHIRSELILDGSYDPRYILIYTTDEIMRSTEELVISGKRYVYHYGPFGYLEITSKAS